MKTYLKHLVSFIILSAICVSLFLTTASGIRGGEKIVFVDEQKGLLHDPSRPEYLSIADGYVIIRLKQSKNYPLTEIFIIVMDRMFRMRKQLDLGAYNVWYANIQYSGSGFKYYFKALFTNGTELVIYYSREEHLFVFNGTNIFPQVEWVKNRVGYEIFPERFSDGDPSNNLLGNLTDSLWLDETTDQRPVFTKWNGPITPLHCCHQYFGGDIKGIIERLDYLKELGVGLIYLTPIFVSGSAHGYDTYDYLTVDPKFGSLEDVEKLLEEAHKRDIKIIFDYVPDHVGLGFWAFEDVYEKGPQSKYWKWFIVYKWPFKRGDGSAYRCWWGFGSLPQLNTLNPEVRNYLYNVTIYWLSIGFDGFRVDTPEDVLGSKQFFENLRRIVKEKYPDAYIVGEIWSNKVEWLNGKGFDSLMNYYVGRNILLRYARGVISGVSAANSLSRYYASIGVNVAGMDFNIIGSHDTSRVLTDLGGGRLGDTPSRTSINRLKLLATLQYTIPGIPVIFQGDERGINGYKQHYDEQRYPIQWNMNNKEVFDYYRELGMVKNNLTALHTSIIRILPSEGSILAYTRGYNDEVLVVSNNDNANYHFYTLPEGTWRLLLVSNLSNKTIIYENNTIIVPPLTAVILTKKEPLPSPTNTTTTTIQPPTTPTNTTTFTTTSTMTHEPTLTSTTESPTSIHDGNKQSGNYVYTILIVVSLLVIATAISANILVLRKHGTHH